MRYRLHRSGRIVFQRWIAAPEEGDLTAVMDALRAERKAAGGDLVVVEVVSAAGRLPSRAATREARSLIQPMRHLRSFHFVVIEGDPIRRRLVLGIFTMMMFLFGETPECCATSAEALRRACMITGQNYQETAAEIAAQGLLDHPYEFWA